MFKNKKRRQRCSHAIAVLVLSILAWFFTPARAGEECATDFFSQKTCRSFDTMERNTGKNIDGQERVPGTEFWNNYSGFSGSQIWYRNPLDSNSMLMAPRGRETLDNQAIHKIRCLTDLFGNVVCERSELASQFMQDQKFLEQKLSN